MKLLKQNIIKIKNADNNLHIHGAYVLVILILLDLVLGAVHMHNYIERVDNVNKEQHTALIEKMRESVFAEIEANKEYAYNEQVPKEVVEAEIRKQAEQFGVNADKAVALAKCESGLNNLAINGEGSTATGVYQFVIRTWNATGSWKVYRRARTEYKSNIFETMVKLSAGQSRHWEYCGRQAGFHK